MSQPVEIRDMPGDWHPVISYRGTQVAPDGSAHEISLGFTLQSSDEENAKLLRALRMSAWQMHELIRMGEKV